MKVPEHKPRALTPQDVRHIVGDLDDAVEDQKHLLSTADLANAAAQADLTAAEAALADTEARLAEIKQCSPETIARATSANFERLFRRVTDPPTGVPSHEKVD